EPTMRPTILTGLLSLSMTACLADVGGGDCVGERCKDSTVDAGTTTDPACTNPKEISTAVTLRTMADFDTLPKTCWSLNATLRVEGQAITSLAKLGDLVDVN